MTAEHLLHIEKLSVSTVQEPRNAIIQEVSFAVPSTSIVALVGGSGSGKTTTGLGILQLLPPALKIDSGRILFRGEDLLTKNRIELESIRGKDIGMVFQDPLQAFNPVFTIGFQVSEVFERHTAIPRDGIQGKVLELFVQVGLDDPARVYRSYPHQLSGGMRQRAMIAQAVAATPALLIADEPTSSLDVTLQAKILELFKSLKDIYQFSIILITHDLGVVSHVSDYIVVMNRGAVVETGKTKDVMANPKHIYTQQLIGTMLE